MTRTSRLPLVFLVLLLAMACASEPALVAEEAPADQAEASQETDMTDTAPSDDTFYAIGFFVSSQLAPFDLSPDELSKVQQGIADGATGKEPKVDMQAQGPVIQALAQERAAAIAAREADESKTFLEERAKTEGVEITDSGLIFETITEGTGESPKATDRVKVHYHGTLRDGSVFDSSVDRGEPATFGLNQVIPCWTEGVQMMKVGGKARLVCPADIAYGDRGAPPRIPPGAALVFEVELLEIVG